MLSIELIDPKSPYLTEVIALWGEHRSNLGFFPDQAFIDYARKRGILVALKDGKVVGYLLSRISRERAVVVHLCVASEARKQGVAHTLIDGLRERTKEQRGVFLKCRQDYDAHATWPRLGFANVGESQGRAANGSTLIHWWLDYGHPDLFDHATDNQSLDVAMDANVFVDLMDQRHEESLGLQADWLQESITLCYTHELLNDVGRNENSSVRLRRRSEAEQFALLRSTPEQYQAAEATLQPLFPNLPTVRDESDFRHLVRALAAEANVFVTRDEALLEQSQSVFNACGLSVVRPAQLIGQLDTLLKEKDYQRQFVAGTKEVTQTRIGQLESGFVDAITRNNNEPKRELTARLNRYLADPERYQLHCLTNSDGEPLATFVTQQVDQTLQVPLLRVPQGRQSGSITRYVLAGLVRRAIANGATSVFVPEGELTPVIGDACSESGFLPVEKGKVKLVLVGMLTSTEALAQISWEGPHIDQLRAAIPQASQSASVASLVEHLLWPAKLVDAKLPSYIVPIRPQYAEHLFDEDLASGGLFGADVDLALNPEAAYYRAVKPFVLSCPSRVLWYVSHKREYGGSKAIRACSRIVELASGTPKELFPQFRRLGVYDWPDVLGTADGDVNKEIMAFRFDDSQSLRPIPWDQFQTVLQAHGVNTQLQSPTEIPTKAFCDIYALAFDPSEVR